ncbi:MAG: response regulator, partial [Pseudomonadota bacterium]
IRTPMNGILGMAELVLSARPSSQIEGYARTIISSGESLQQIIDDILDFSKIEAGKMELDPMPVDMLKLVDEVATLYSVKARDKAIELVVRYAPGTEQFVVADPLRVRQVLNNLVSNAIKFTDRGHVLISVEQDENTVAADDQVQRKFSVSDTGIGLSEEAQLRIFDKFAQADNSTTRKYGGTGLGLSICQSLTALMRGDIGVKSRAGGGATFWFTLSLPRNRSESHIQPKPPALKGVRVLVVDDLLVIRKIGTEILKSAGMRCDAVESGEEALEQLQKAQEEGDPYKIAVLDYLMPGMNGEMLASAINDHDELRETCLVMLTAAGNPLADDEFAKKGFSGYIAKPVRAQALIESLAIIWGEYENGQRDVLIRVDARGLGKPLCGQHEPELPEASILVAEDNLVNQVFIKEILEEMKCRCVIVSNGQEAVDEVKAKGFDLIVMDCLMPIMDGFEATRAICGLKEDGAIQEDLPILALTANAMKGDREKCLAAGMDDYMSKPVRKLELKETVYRLINKMPLSSLDKGMICSGDDIQRVEIAETTPDILTPINDVLDEDAVENARSILKGKYDEMVNVYIENSWARLDEMTNAIDQSDVESIIRPAHTLKSTSKQMGAVHLSDIAKQIEVSARELMQSEDLNEQNIDSIALAMNDLKSALTDTKRAFDKMAA